MERKPAVAPSLLRVVGCTDGVAWPLRHPLLLYGFVCDCVCFVCCVLSCSVLFFVLGVLQYVVRVRGRKVGTTASAICLLDYMARVIRVGRHCNPSPSSCLEAAPARVVLIDEF